MYISCTPLDVLHHIFPILTFLKEVKLYTNCHANHSLNNSNHNDENRYDDSGITIEKNLINTCDVITPLICLCLSFLSISFFTPLPSTSLYFISLHAPLSRSRLCFLQFLFYNIHLFFIKNFLSHFLPIFSVSPLLSSFFLSSPI